MFKSLIGHKINILSSRSIRKINRNINIYKDKNQKDKESKQPLKLKEICVIKNKNFVYIIVINGPHVEDRNGSPGV